VKAKVVKGAKADGGKQEIKKVEVKHEKKSTQPLAAEAPQKKRLNKAQRKKLQQQKQ